MKESGFKGLFLTGAMLAIAVFALFTFIPGQARTILGLTDRSATASNSTASNNSDSYLTDSVFSAEDVAQEAPFSDHRNYLSAEQYAGYCRKLQSSGQYSKNVHVNAVLAVKAYVVQEELPTYEQLLGNIPADASDDTVMSMAIANSQAMWDKYRDPNAPRVTATQEMVEDTMMAPFALHQEIVALCR